MIERRSVIPRDDEMIQSAHRCCRHHPAVAAAAGGSGSRVNRRAFVTGLGAVLAAPLVAEAQEAGRVYRVAIVHPVRRVADMTEGGDEIYRTFFSELRRLGYVEGKNLVVERRSGEGHTGRYSELAREVVQLRPDVIAPARRSSWLLSRRRPRRSQSWD